MKGNILIKVFLFFEAISRFPLYLQQKTLGDAAAIGARNECFMDKVPLIKQHLKRRPFYKHLLQLPKTAFFFKTFIPGTTPE